MRPVSVVCHQRRRQVARNLKSLHCVSIDTRPSSLDELPQLADVMRLSALSSTLSELRLHDYSLNQALIEAIAQLGGLEVLDLSACWLPAPHQLHSLFRLTKLRTLYLPHCGGFQVATCDVIQLGPSLSITDFRHGVGFSLPDYAWMTRLSRLCLHSVHITSEMFASLPMLTQLRLYNCEWDEDPSTAIAHLRGLELLGISWGHALTDDVLEQIALLLPELRDLILSHHRFTHVGLRHLTKLAHLHRLEVSRDIFRCCDDTILSQFAALRTLRVNSSEPVGLPKWASRIICFASQLHTLVINSSPICAEFFDDVENLSELRTLRLVNVTRGAGEFDLSKLVQLRCLVSVDVEPCAGGIVPYTDDAVEFLRAAGICLSPSGRQHNGGLVGQVFKLPLIKRVCWWILPYTMHYERYTSRSEWVLDITRARLMGIIGRLKCFLFAFAIVHWALWALDVRVADLLAMGTRTILNNAPFLDVPQNFPTAMPLGQ